MRNLSKYMALLLILLVTVNAVFAAQMTVSMIDNATAPVIETTQPCHGDSSNSVNHRSQELPNCCEGDCNSCVSGVVIVAVTHALAFYLPSSLKMGVSTGSILQAHNPHLFRPPILI